MTNSPPPGGPHILIALALCLFGAGCGDSANGPSSPVFYDEQDTGPQDSFQWPDVTVHNPFVEQWELPLAFCPGLEQITEEGCTLPSDMGPSCPGLFDTSCEKVIPGPSCNEEADPTGDCIRDALAISLCADDCQPAQTPGPLSLCDINGVPSVPDGISDVVHVNPTAPLNGANGSLENPFPSAQLAFDFAEEGSWVLLHPGTHNGPLSITKPMTIKGCGPDEVILAASSASPSILTVNAPGLVQLEGVSLTGGTIALHLLGGAQAAVQDVEIHDISGVGVLTESGSVLTLNRVQIRDIIKDKINPGIYPGSGIVTNGSIEAYLLKIERCSAQGISATKCTLQITDSEIADNDGGGVFATSLYEGSSVLRTLFEDNAFRSISLESGVLNISNTTVKGTRISQETTANLSGIYLADGASVSLDKLDVNHDESGFAIEMSNAFITMKKTRATGATTEGLIRAQGEPFSTPASLVMEHCSLETIAPRAIQLKGPIQMTLHSSLIEGNGGIESEGPSTFMNLDNLVIMLEENPGIRGKSGTYLTLSNALVSSKEAPLIALSDASTLDMDSVITQGEGESMACWLDSTTAEIRHHQHQGGKGAWLFVGETASGTLSHSSSTNTSFAAALALDGASLSIQHTLTDSQEPQWIESGPFSVVGTNESTVSLEQSELGAIRLDHANTTVTDCSLRALHIESPPSVVHVVRTQFTSGEQAAIHLRGKEGVLEGESISMQEGQVGITLETGASATLKHLDILEPTGVGIALLGGSLVLDDVLVRNAGDHGIHAKAPEKTSSLNNVWIDECSGAGIWAENTELLLESTWVSQTHHGGLSGEGDGLVASDNAHVVMGSGGLVLNARAGALFQDASGIVAGMALDENGGEYELNLVLQGNSDVDWTGLAITPIEPDETNALAFPILSFVPPEIYPLTLPAFDTIKEQDTP